MKCINCVIILIVSISQVYGYSYYGHSYSDVDNLYVDVLTGYNKDIRPVLNQADLMRVNVSYDIGNLLEINEIEGTMTLFFIFQYSWIDERIKWSPTLYNYTNTITLPWGSVWKPELVLVNPTGPVVSVDSSMTKVRFFSSGAALWFPNGMIAVSCTVNIEFYPFDTQNCPIMFADSNYISTEMEFHLINKEAPLNFYTENGVWEITKTEAYVIDNGVNIFVVNLTMARKPTFVVMIVIIPIMLLSFLNIMVFLLPPDSGERMSFSITLLLALAVFLTIISDNIPKTSNPLPILCYFIGLHVLLSTAISVVIILNLRLYHKDGKINVPSWFRLCFRTGKVERQCQVERYTGAENAHDDTDSLPVTKNGDTPYRSSLSVVPVTENDESKTTFNGDMST